MDEATIQPRRPAPSWQTRPVSDLGLGPAMVVKLRDAGFMTFGDVDAAPDEALTAIAGLGPKTVASMREALAAWKWTPGG
jgi:predicted flap endonuclease-1-like 5' DNA nuclease